MNSSPSTKQTNSVALVREQTIPTALDHLAQILKQRPLDEPKPEEMIMTVLNLTVGFGIIAVFEDSG
jgi:hypothetical protein